MEFLKFFKDRFFSIFSKVGHEKGRWTSLLVFGLSRWNMMVRRHSAEGPAMDAFYFYHKIHARLRHELKPVTAWRWEDAWRQVRLRMEIFQHGLYAGHFSLRKGVSNRLTNVVYAIQMHAVDRWGSRRDGETYRILSFAAGRGTDVQLAVEELHESYPDMKFDIKLLDRDMKSLRIALRRIAKVLGADFLKTEEMGDMVVLASGGHRVTICKKNLHPRRFAKIAEKEIRDFEPDVVAVMGFPDYLNDNQVEEMAQRIHASLKRGACIITANILKSAGLMERAFLHLVIWWPPMFYRTEEQFAVAFRSFGLGNCTLMREPTRSFIVLFGRRG